MLSKKGLVEHCKMALAQKWGYVWGTFGLVLTPSIFKNKCVQYPDGVDKYASFIKANWLNKRTVDCVGLIKSYVWWTNEGPVYSPSTDVSADYMFKIAKKKGPIKEIPMIAGICVWKSGHIGVYVGDGHVIEAHGTKYGVIQTPLFGAGATDWTHWLECPFIKNEEELETILKLQNNLNKLGYKLVVDGLYGPATKDAVIHFQENNNVSPDGIISDRVILLIDAMIAKIYGNKKTYTQILQEVSTSPDEWLKTINEFKNHPVLKNLPLLIEKIHNKYKKDEIM
jgi:hypothetical protein